MSRNAKIALIVVGALVVICLGVCGVGFIGLQRFGSQFGNPQNAQKVGSEIADYTLPEGYSELMGVDVLIYKMVMIAPSSKSNGQGMAFMLMGMNTPTANQEQMQQQMQQAFQQQYGKTGTTHVVGQENVMIRGNQTSLTIAGTDSSTGRAQATIRQAIGTFQGKNGLVILMVMGSKAAWDDTLMREFLSLVK